MALREPHSLDYSLLSKTEHGFATHRGPLSMLVCGDWSCQSLVPLLKHLFAEQGFALQITVSEFEFPEQLETLSFTARPDYLCLLPTLQGFQRKTDAEVEAQRWLAAGLAFKQKWGTKVLLADYPDSTPLSPAQIANQLLYSAIQQTADVHLIPIQSTAAQVGLEHWNDARLWYAARIPCALDHLGRYAFEIVKAALLPSSPIKVVVVDFDNTLWGGEVGDRGPLGVEVGETIDGEAYADLQRLLLQLTQQGIILVGCSRNHRAQALGPFEQNSKMLLKLTDFSFIEASLDNKTLALERIREKTNVDFNAMVFVDDSPFEREMVRQVLPAVIVPELPADPCLRVEHLRQRLWAEHCKRPALPARNALMQQEFARTEERKAFAAEEDFLQSLRMTGTIALLQESQRERALELFNRTHQYNFSSLRYSAADLAALESASDAFVWQVSLQDRIGSYGLIAVIVARIAGPALVIENLVMSCRVAGRGVEEFILNFVKQQTQDHGLQRAQIRLKITEKNLHCRSILERNQFVASKTAIDHETWDWPVSPERNSHRIQHEP